ncbi:hypothetical protein FHETE_10629 [Fusarium heterosporum]|uniref:Uncharacterized protein n=1 Tax=Fusarium heterosporum TaxID=42747 RepID=A0A8H5WEI6_FUSHE|nr:hypothetical protein FHETE_10629 [Fusarium heterosporum]
MSSNSNITKPSTTPASSTGGDPKLLPPQIVEKLKKWAKKDISKDEDIEEGGVKLDQCSDTEEGGVKL